MAGGGHGVGIESQSLKERPGARLPVEARWSFWHRSWFTSR